jgi:23S rRNA pseudouridine2605 synthase
MILTNDGDLTLRITHPRYGIHKTYVVLVAGTVEPATLRRLTGGIQLDDGPASMVKTRLLDQSDTHSLVEVTMGEGRKRIVRRMFDETGHPVERLVRTAIGPIRDKSLKAGEHRTMTVDEIRALYAAGKGVANG